MIDHDESGKSNSNPPKTCEGYKNFESNYLNLPFPLKTHEFWTFKSVLKIKLDQISIDWGVTYKIRRNLFVTIKFTMSHIFNFPIEIDPFRVVKDKEDLKTKINH